MNIFSGLSKLVLKIYLKKCGCGSGSQYPNVHGPHSISGIYYCLNISFYYSITLYFLIILYFCSIILLIQCIYCICFLKMLDWIALSYCLITLAQDNYLCSLGEKKCHTAQSYPTFQQQGKGNANPR